METKFNETSTAMRNGNNTTCRYHDKVSCMYQEKGESKLGVLNALPKG